MHPPELMDELAPLVRRPGDLNADEMGRFVDATPDELAQPFDFQQDLSHFKWALATAQSYRAIGLKLWRELAPDVLLVYIEGVDSSSHLFGHLFRRENLYGELAEQARRYGRTVEEMYRYADDIVGSYLDALDDDTTLVVLSDHGFDLGVLHENPSWARDLRRVSERFHKLEGILYLYGNRVHAGRRLERPTLLDVAPTVLALAGVPPAADMKGRVLAEGLELPTEMTSAPRIVATYETEGASIETTALADEARVAPAILEHLRALGYLDVSSPKGEENFAALHFEQGEYEEAAHAYAELVREQPDSAGLRSSLAGALGALGRYDESLAELERAIELDPTNPGPYHNRGVILERRRDEAAAARAYETALRYAPDYEPSKQALLRLRGYAIVDRPTTADERRASSLTEEAHQAALRGDYAGAIQMLAEAEEIAPDLGRISHYRSNVAWLMGDRAGAIAALLRAIELEPDNPLYRTNLQRLEAGAKSSVEAGTEQGPGPTESLGR
jgi:Flp pilus assembly protein TadD